MPTVLSLLHKPWYQAAACLLLTAAFMPAIRPEKLDSLWTIAGLAYLLFLLSNAIGQWFANRSWGYFGFSLLCSVLYLFAARFLVQICAGLLGSKGSGESGMIFLVIMFHPPLLLLTLLAKFLYLKFLA